MTNSYLGWYGDILGVAPISSGGKPKAPGPPSPVVDEKPPSLSIRGTWVPLLIGRQRVAPDIVLATNRKQHVTLVGATPGGGGGKKGMGGGGGAPGFPGVPVTTWTEDAIHCICIGPAHKLHRIIIDGKVRWVGPITADSDPSGSDIEGDNGNVFEINWGEDRPPFSSYLADELDISSRWPKMVWVRWKQRDLGQSTHWPTIEYDIETRPWGSRLISTKPTITFDPEEFGKRFDVLDAFNGEDGQAWVTVPGNKKKYFHQGTKFKIEGNNTDEDIHVVLRSKYHQTGNFTRIFILEDMDDLDVAGQVIPLRDSGAEGVNPAHAIYQLLFAGFPHGLGLDTEDFDLASLEAFSDLCGPFGESLPSSFIARDGKSAKELLGEIMLDFSLAISFFNGLYRFVPLRPPTKDLPTLKSGAIIPSYPEIQTMIGKRVSDHVTFEFPDVKRRFRTNDIPEDEDGQATLKNYKSFHTIKINSAVEKHTARKIAKRRIGEVFGDTNSLKVLGNHDARLLYPGLAYLSDVMPNRILRVTDQETFPLSGKVQLDTRIDVFAVDPDTLEDIDDGDDPEDDGNTQDPDEIVNINDAPPVTQSDFNNPGLWVTRARANESIGDSLIYISKDDKTYDKMGRMSISNPGGELLQPLLKSDGYLIKEGPTFTPIGPDISDVIDITIDEETWRDGVQLLIIGKEICFLQSVQPLGDGNYQTKGIIRARLGTDLEDHPAGTRFTVVTADKVFVTPHPWIKAGKTIYIKSFPQGADGSLNLDEIPSLSHTIERSGNMGAPIINLRADRWDEHPNTFAVGQTSHIKWGWFGHPEERTGAGEIGAGEPADIDDPDGYFVLRILDSIDTVVRTVSKLKTPSFDYTHAMRAADFPFYGGAPNFFKVRVRHHRGGYSGPETVIQVNLIIPSL